MRSRALSTRMWSYPLHSSTLMADRTHANSWPGSIVSSDSGTHSALSSESIRSIVSIASDKKPVRRKFSGAEAVRT